MKNRNFDYEIEFGKTINVKKKINNYKTFFQKAALDSSLYKYKKIKSDLKIDEDKCMRIINNVWGIY